MLPPDKPSQQVHSKKTIDEEKISDDGVIFVEE
jgi:hypothetical protein